jgi:hypothetical protein
MLRLPDFVFVSREHVPNYTGGCSGCGSRIEERKINVLQTGFSRTIRGLKLLEFE